MAVIPIAMAIPVTIFAKPIIHIIFGSGYLEAVPILRIYIWSSVGVFLNYAIYHYLVSENFIKTIFWTNLLTMFINIILNIVLIPAYGIAGSAWATLISYAIPPLCVLIFIRQKS